MGTGTRRLVDEADAGFLQPRQLGDDVVYLEGDMMRALAPLRHIFRDRPIRIGRLDQLQPAGAAAERHRDDLLLRNLVALATGEAERGVIRCRRIEITNDVPHMVQTRRRNGW